MLEQGGYAFGKNIYEIRKKKYGVLGQETARQEKNNAEISPEKSKNNMHTCFKALAPP